MLDDNQNELSQCFMDVKEENRIHLENKQGLTKIDWVENKK